jgi:transposase
METKMDTEAETIRQFVKGLGAHVHLTFEEGTQANWLYELLKPLVAELIVCEPRHNKLLASGNKSDKVDSRKLAELLRLGSLRGVYHDNHSTRMLKELVRVYDGLVSDSTRVMNRIKAIYRSRGIATAGRDVYQLAGRQEWLGKIPEAAYRTRLGVLYRQLDALRELRKEARRTMAGEVRQHPAYKLLNTVPSLGAVRIAQIIAIVISPYRFRSKRQFWPYCGFAVVTVGSAEYRNINGKICRVKKVLGTRGLNHNYNRRLKHVFKSAAEYASGTEPFKAYYEGLLAKHMRKEMAKLTLARKIAATTLTVWKSGQNFDANRLKEQ